MSETPISLLERLRERPDRASWQRLHDVYEPLLRSWLQRYALQPADADDVIQEIYGVLVHELGQFRHNGRPGAFRTWLRGLMVNRLRQFWREQQRQAPPMEGLVDELEDPASNLSRLWEAQHDQYVARRLLAMLAGEFEETTWQAFRMLMFEDLSTAAVAASLGLSPNAVRLAKSRVLRRFRREVEGLIE